MTTVFTNFFIKFARAMGFTAGQPVKLIKLKVVF